MKIIYWENIISQHKLPYWKALASSDKIEKFILVVKEELSNELKLQGWQNNIEDYSKMELVINPIDERIEEILKNNIEDTYHVFSGIKAIPMVYTAFKISLKYPIKRILLTETVNIYGIRALTRRLASFMIERKYLKYFDLVLGSGSSTRKWYLECGLEPEKFFPFLYSVESPEKIIQQISSTGQIKFIFIGQLIKRKGLDVLINALSKVKQKNWTLDVYGGGEDENNLVKQVNNLNLKDKIFFKGVVKNNVLRNILSDYTTLVLPSRFDGWGAVVNEAISAGLQVVCSDRCGASILLVNDKVGSVFKTNNAINLTCVLESTINNFRNYDRGFIVEYSEFLTGQNVANYLIEILEFYYGKKEKKPLTPWGKYLHSIDNK